TKPMYQHCLDIMDGATVMAYRDTAGQALFRCTDVIDYGTSLNKPVSIGQETGWHNASGNVTYAEEIQAENDSTRFNYMEGEFAAIYNQVTNKPGFERIVIHDIPQYFCWFFNNQTPAAFLDGGGTWTYTDPLDLGQDDSYWADWPENSSNFSSSQAASSAGSSGIPASSAASSAAGLRPAPAVKLNSHILDITASQTVVFYFMDKEENMLTASTGRFKLYDQLGNLLLDWQMENTDLNSGTFSWDGSGADLKHPGIYLFQIKFDQTKLIGSLVVKTSG
ncbi:MAG TPA: hypothetical protein VKS21_10615, partial [Spirochaetota bacterium]|nr:hypothetical protein [Spirochaetota bacterium]